MATINNKQKGSHVFQPKTIEGNQGWECVKCRLWHDFPRDARLPKEIDDCPAEVQGHDG